MDFSIDTSRGRPLLQMRHGDYVAPLDLEHASTLPFVFLLHMRQCGRALPKSTSASIDEEFTSYWTQHTLPDILSIARRLPVSGTEFTTRLGALQLKTGTGTQKYVFQQSGDDLIWRERTGRNSVRNMLVHTASESEQALRTYEAFLVPGNFKRRVAQEVAYGRKQLDALVSLYAAESRA